MNDCERYELMISALLDGELDEREKAELSAHISGCSRCAATAAAFAAVSGALADGLEEAPAGLQGAVMEKVGAAAKVRRSQTRFMRLRPIVAAAACVAVVVVTLLAANRGLYNVNNAASGGSMADTSAETAVYTAGGDGAALNGDPAGTGGENGAAPMAEPASAPAGAAVEHDASDARSMGDADAPEEAVTADDAGMEEVESETKTPAALPELEVEAVAAGEGSFTAAVVADPSGNFTPGALITVVSDEAVSPGARVTVRYSALGAASVTAEEIEVNE